MSEVHKTRVERLTKEHNDETQDAAEIPDDPEELQLIAYDNYGWWIPSV